jgi:hypothetical protein
VPVADLVETHPAPTVRTRPHLGFDRVLWQRLERRHGAVTGAIVAGVRHRRPVTVRVDVHTAGQLAAAGVPTLGRRDGSGS